MEYFKVLKYIEENKGDTELVQFRLKQYHNGKPFISYWNYDFPQPSEEDLIAKDPTDLKQREQIKQKIKEMKLVELSEQNRVKFDRFIPNSSIWLNRTTNRINYKDDGGLTYEIIGILIP
jgi:hypothetical protein